MSRTAAILAAAAVFVALVFGVALLGVAVSADPIEYPDEGDITIDLPDNQTIEVELMFSEEDTVDIELLNDTGDVVDSHEATGDGTYILELHADESGAHTINVSDGTNVNIERVSHITEVKIEVDDAENQTIDVDLGADDTEAEATVYLFDEEMNELASETVTFDEDSEQMVTFNQSLIDGNLTVQANLEPAESYTFFSAGIPTASGGGWLLDGETFGIPNDYLLIGMVALVAGYIWKEMD